MNAFAHCCSPTKLLLCASFAILTIAATQARAQEGGTSGRDKSGFFIKGENTGLTIGGIMQARYTSVFRDAPGVTDSAEDIVTGFTMRRTRLITTATLTEAIKLKIELSADNTSDVSVIDAFATIKLAKDTLLDVGAFKGPGTQELLASDSGTTFAEKSTLNSVFNQGRSDGIMVTRTWAVAEGSIRARAGINDGHASSFSEFDGGREADLAAAARVDWTDNAGDFSRFNSLSGFRGGKSGWLVGAAIHSQTGGETAGTTDRDLMQLTADVTHLNDGWSFFGAVVYRNIESTSGDFSDWGAVAQAGYFITDTSQVAGRITYIAPDNDRANSDGYLEVGAAYNYFLLPSSHAHKLIADITWAGEQAQSSSLISESASTGIRASEDDQIMVRVQYQVQF